MRILFSDGEEIDHEDFNLAREIGLKHLFDSVLANMAGSEQAFWSGASPLVATEELRPLRGGGNAQYSTGTNAVTVFGGLWIQIDYGGPLNSDAPIGSMAHGESPLSISGFASAPSGQFRRDIIQSRIVSVDDAAISRDFKDAVTGALSTITPVKRSRLVVEHQRKAGTVQASQALADDPANEVAPDAGWFKTHSVLVSDAGLLAQDENHWDWRKPWGYSLAFTHPSEMYFDPALSFALQNPASLDQLGGAIGTVMTLCPIRMNHGSDPVRIQTLIGSYDYVVPPVPGQIAIAAVPLGVPSANPWPDDNSIVVTGVSGDHTLIDPSLTQRPLWTNGKTNPLDKRSMLRIAAASTQIADFFGGYEWRAWGGF